MPPSTRGAPFSAASPSRFTTDAADEIGVGGIREASISAPIASVSSWGSSGGGVGTAGCSLSTITIEPEEAEDDRLFRVLPTLLSEACAGDSSVSGYAARDDRGGVFWEGFLPTWPK